MFDLRRSGFWLAVLLIPGGVLLLPIALVAYLRRYFAKKQQKSENSKQDGDPKTSNDDSGPNPRTPNDGPTPRLAA